MVKLCQAQFHIPFPLSVAAAFHIARASVAWAQIDNDLGEVERSLTRFYRIARRWSGLTFHPPTAAALELRYWIEHRRLSGQPDKARFQEAMTALHCHLFNLRTDTARESAEWRVRANNTVDEITSGRSPDPEADWRKLESELRESYQSVQRELNGA